MAEIKFSMIIWPSCINFDNHPWVRVFMCESGNSVKIFQHTIRAKNIQELMHWVSRSVKTGEDDSFFKCKDAYVRLQTTHIQIKLKEKKKRKNFPKWWRKHEKSKGTQFFLVTDLPKMQIYQLPDQKLK